MTEVEDVKYMSMALRLAEKGRGTTSPNPMVGALVVKGGQVVGEGYHRKAGGPHAEAIALQQAAAKARGATLYVTLEPCCHLDKKTPPCTKEIIARGIARVVAAAQDPNPRVSGKGFRELARAGITITKGVLGERAERLNEAYARFITSGRPFVIMKVAQSIDGKIAAGSGESRRMTGEEAGRFVHRLRSEVDSVVVGIGTVLSDDPSLTVRFVRGRNPVRIVLDSRLRIPLTARVLQGEARTIIAATKSVAETKVKEIQQRGAEVLLLEEREGRVSFTALVDALGRMGIVSLLIEGGSEVNSSALRAGVVDKVIFLVAPTLIGGTDAKGSIGGPSPLRLADAIPVSHLTVRRIGRDLALIGYITPDGKR